MRGAVLIGVVAALALVWLADERDVSMSSERKKTKSSAGPDRDWSKLEPRFADRLRRVFDALRARGYSPVLNEGWRSRERAEKLAGEGKGVELSMHCYGLGADVREERSGWSDPSFFVALGEESEREGLVWGGRWKRRDATHVQAIPTSAQARLRREAVELQDDAAAARRAVERTWGVA